MWNVVYLKEHKPYIVEQRHLEISSSLLLPMVQCLLKLTPYGYAKQMGRDGGVGKNTALCVCDDIHLPIGNLRVIN